MAVICCWRSGEVEVHPRDVHGALTIARGPKVRLEQALVAVARHAYDGKTLLVPGVPEADSDEDAMTAVLAFTSALERRIYRRKMAGAAS